MRASVFACLAVLAATSGCAPTMRQKIEMAAASALVSDQQESQIGLQVNQELDKQGVRYLTDPTVTGFVQTASDRILAHAKKDRGGVSWSVRVIDDPKTVNAFATPGGYLYVYSGLVLAATNEAELAAVMGHEAAHVVLRHSARQMVTAFGLEAVAAMALGKNPGTVAQLAASLVGTGAMLANSRSDESESDELGTTYAAAAGYEPHGIATFFGRMAQEQGRTPQVLKWLSTHPAPEDRVGKVNTYIAKFNLGGGPYGTGGDSIAPVKARLGGR